MSNIRYFSSDSVLEEFYSALADGSSSRLERVHIPRSEVMYVRAAIEADTGIKYSLDRIERALYVEGMLNRGDVLDPDRIRKFDDGQEY